MDEKTGYRYYGTEQVRKAAQLSFLRNLNIPLVHIADILEKKSGLKKYFTRSGKRLELLRQQIKISHALQSIALCDYDDNLISDQIETTVIQDDCDDTGGKERNQRCSGTILGFKPFYASVEYKSQRISLYHLFKGFQH